MPRFIERTRENGNAHEEIEISVPASAHADVLVSLRTVDKVAGEWRIDEKTLSIDRVTRDNLIAAVATQKAKVR